MTDIFAPLSVNDGNASEIKATPAFNPSDSDLPSPPALLVMAPNTLRRSQLERASRAYADILPVLAPGPDIDADLMREQFAEQVTNPERYHRIDEAENSKGLRIGDNVIRSEMPERVFTITSICAREADGERRVEVHAIARDTYGGWVGMESVQKVKVIRPDPVALPPEASYESQSQVAESGNIGQVAVIPAVTKNEAASSKPHADAKLVPNTEHHLVDGAPFSAEQSATNVNLEQARILLAQFIDQSGDLFGMGGIHLLAGSVNAPQRVQLLSLLRGGVKVATREASTDVLRQTFYLAAGISGSTPTELEDNFARWYTRPSTIINPPDREIIQATSSSDANIDTNPADDLPQVQAAKQTDGENTDTQTLAIDQRKSYSDAIKLVADWVTQRLCADLPNAFTARELFDVANTAFGGSQTTGRYAVKDAYDAMEIGINQAIIDMRIAPGGNAADAANKLWRLDRMLRLVPTQKRRTTETEGFQQFSSPPTLAFAAAWVANIIASDVMVEPSAGTGSIAIFGVLAGAEVIVNELSSRRAAVLATLLPKQQLFMENAEQLHNALPDSIQPTIIVMNPPFSATAGRMHDTRQSTVGARHIEQALRRLAPGGRLVAIVGRGMAMGRPGSAQWWNLIKASYTVRANVGIDGKNYAKYGTTFDIQLLVIDKTGPTLKPVLVMNVDDIAELLPLLEEIRHDRPVPASQQRTSPESGGTALATARVARRARNANPDADALGSGKRPVDHTDGAQSSGSGAGRGDAGTARASQAGQGDRIPDRPGADGKGRDGTDGDGPGEADMPAGCGDAAAGNSVQQHGGDASLNDTPIDAPISIGQRASAKNVEALSDAIYEHYQPQRLTIDGANSHPGKLVQSAAMAATEPPVPHYVPRLPRSVIDQGQLSLPQLEAVVYAGQAHEQRLPGGQRRGFFIGDGTGVGKGRTIAGIILDNQRSGRKKAVWISEKSGLLRDAQRDLVGVGGDPAAIFPLGRVKLNEPLPVRDGVLFASYTLLAATQRNPNVGVTPSTSKARLQQLISWLGADFDGVIVFDESHNMANSITRRGARGATLPSAKALAGIALQESLPNARVVYVSATGATEVANLAYAGRLGLWGEGTPFATVSDFIGAISAGGVAAMELVSRDMKAMGVYLARSLSFEGVSYERLEHQLTPLQTDMYNELAGAWQTVLQNVERALEDTGQAKDGAAKSATLSRFWGAHQRFFNQVITSMQMPTVIAQARADIERGEAVVMQLVNTNEAAQERQLADMAASGADLDELDFTPRQNLIDYVKTGFPIQQHEEYKDDNGNVRSRPVFDAAGQPLTNKDMETQRDALLKTLAAIRVPDNPIDLILNAFGPDMVAEVTGRSRRFILQRDDAGDMKPVEQKRPPAAAVADADAFMDDKKRILVFSDAGGTGYSYHADLKRANQRQRSHYLIQPGWRADKAIQGLGRTHRTNEASQPHYKLPTTNLEAQRRFMSSIARRLDQLGALTKGQRQTGSQGLFDASDNLESDYARRALRILFMDMFAGHASLDFRETTHAMGLNGLIDARTGALNEGKLPSIPQFLNRLLSLKTDEQDRVFGAFFERMEQLIDSAKERGDYDHGVETMRAQSIEKVRDEMVHADARTGAETHYVELALHSPTRLTQFDVLPIRTKDGELLDNFIGYFRNEKTHKVFALQRTGQGTNEKGIVVTRARHSTPVGPTRHVENADQVAAAALGRIMIKRRQLIPVYGGPVFSEAWIRNGRTHIEYSSTAAAELERGGMAALERLATMPGIASERRLALIKVVEKIKSNLIEKELEREVRAYTRLTEAEAREEWNAELAAAPKTQVQQIHLITGALLPIWDRIPGSPRVIRTQTDEGERLLGRTVAPALLVQTLKNLGVGSDVAKLPPERIIELIHGGAKAILANGWEISSVRVSNEARIEIKAFTMSDSERRLLTQQGAFCERIQWRDRVFVPTGDQAATVLARILAAKPVTEIFDKPRAGAPVDPLFCQAAQLAASTATQAAEGRAKVKHHAGFDLAALKVAARSIQSSWPGAPLIACVQSALELPFPALPTTRGAFHRDTIYLVADNIANDSEFQFVVGHEALGHAGLRAILDQDSLANEMARLRRINPDLDQAARDKVATLGCTIELGTEEALCDLAGRGEHIHGLQSLMLMLQRGLRKAGLGQLADWFESKSQSETLDLLRRAKAAITEQSRDALLPRTTADAVFTHQERERNQVDKDDEKNDDQDASSLAATERTEAQWSAPLREQQGLVTLRKHASPDPFGLRAFGLTSLNQVTPAYRDTAGWRAVPAIMSRPDGVTEIHANLALIEDTHGGMLSLDANGNIVIGRWSPRGDHHAAMTSITALADRHGLGVLTKKSAFVWSIENDKSLRSHGFSILGASITGAATGRDGPPNYVTFMRKPAGAPLFSHATNEAPLGKATASLRMEDGIDAAAYTTRHLIHEGATIVQGHGWMQRRARLSPGA